MKRVLIVESTKCRLIRHWNYNNNCTGMCIEHANIMFEIDLTCLREYEIRTLNDSDLLSAPRILPLPNSLGPRLLHTAGPLSLPLPFSFTILLLPTFHICEPLLDLLFIFLTLLLHFFLLQHSLPPFRSTPCFALNVFLSFGRLLRVQPLYEITKRWWTLLPSRVRFNLMYSEGAN